MDIMLVVRLNRKDVKSVNKNKYIFYIYSKYSNNYFLPNTRFIELDTSVRYIKNIFKSMKIMKKPLVGIIMGSRSDSRIMHGAAEILDEFGVPHEDQLISAHRTPTRLEEYAKLA